MNRRSTRADVAAPDASQPAADRTRVAAYAVCQRRRRPHPALPHRPVGRGRRRLDAAGRRPRIRRAAGRRRPARAGRGDRLRRRARRPRRRQRPRLPRRRRRRPAPRDPHPVPRPHRRGRAARRAGRLDRHLSLVQRRRRPAAAASASWRATRSTSCARTRRADGGPSRPRCTARSPSGSPPRPDLVFALAHDVERWADLLPHYARSSAVERRPDGSVVADFIARRPLIGVLGLGLPVTWRSRTWSEPTTRRLRFVHVAGATRGMDVTWRIEPGRRRHARVVIEHDFRPRLPGFAAVRRSLLHPPDRRPDAGDVQGLAEARAVRDRRRRRIHRHERPAAGLDHGHRPGHADRDGRRRVPGRPARRPLPDQAHRPLRSVRRSARRSPPRSTTSTRWRGCRPRPRASSIDSASSGWSPGRLALDDARLTPGADGAASPERIGIYLGSALGGIAYAEEQHERYLEKGIRQVAPNLALAVFGGAAPANLGIALDVRGPILSTANSCASGAVALGEALGDLREGRVDAAIAGGCEIPLSPLAFGAFDIIRALSAGHNDEPDCAARPFDVGRDGFVMGEGAALLVLEDAGRGRAPGRDALRRAARLRRDVRRPSHGPAAGRRARGGAGRLDRPRRRRNDSRTPSTTSTRTRRRRRSATWPRRGRS